MPKDIYSIMESTPRQLRHIVLEALTRFNDYVQKSPKDKDAYFEHAYKELELHLVSLEGEEVVVEDDVRNEIRMLVKETEKMASITFNKN